MKLLNWLKPRGYWKLRIFSEHYWLYLTVNDGGHTGVTFTISFPRNPEKWNSTPHKCFFYIAIILGKKGWHRWYTCW